MKDEDFPTAPETAKVDPDQKPAPSNVVPMEARKRTTARKTKADSLAEATTVVDELQADMVAVLTPLAPVTAGTWVIYSDANTRAVMRLAASRPGMLKAILAGGDFAAFLALGTFVVAIGVSVGVELGRVEGDGLLAERLKVKEAFDAVVEEQERDARANGAADYYAGARDTGTHTGTSLPGLLGERPATSP